MTPSIDTENLGNTGDGTDPTREGPATIEGATEGGTVTVLTSPGLSTPIDPSDLYYTDTNAIMTSLVTRQLTQYAYDAESGQMILVPDLATDLGTPNDDFTEWTFTLRDGVKWETGAPVTADEVAFGIVRSLDGKTFPNGPGLYYSNPYFLGGEDYKGPYTDPGDDAQQAVTVDGNNITVKMAKPFPDFPYYASIPAIGPIPIDPAVSDPAKYAQHPLATGPYKIEQYTIGKSLTVVSATTSGTRPPTRRARRTRTATCSRRASRPSRSTRSCWPTPVTPRPRSATTTCSPRTTGSSTTPVAWSRAASRAPTSTRSTSARCRTSRSPRR